MSIYNDWLNAKADEKHAVEKRRLIEDKLFFTFSEHKQEGTIIINDDGYNIKIVERLTHKVDGDKLQELAADSGLTGHLSHLFRWTPTINMASWKSSDESITNLLLGAVTTKSGRPSFNIEKEA